jgi:hypothetical protein
MVLLIPTNANPRRSDIDAYIRIADALTLRGVVREIECKSGAGALLHPAEEYFVSRYSALLEHRNSSDSFATIDNSTHNPYNTTQ